MYAQIHHAQKYLTRKTFIYWQSVTKGNYYSMQILTYILNNRDRICLVLCINIFAFEPNLHISQMASLACKILDDVINVHNLTTRTEMLCKYFRKQVSREMKYV